MVTCSSTKNRFEHQDRGATVPKWKVLEAGSMIETIVLHRFHAVERAVETEHTLTNRGQCRDQHAEGFPRSVRRVGVGLSCNGATKSSASGAALQ